MTLDVRTLPPQEHRSSTVFALCDSLAVGQSLIILNDHDPRPLYYRLAHERTGKFEWDSRELKPDEWQATIKRIAP
ncbi:MAG: DUF2249 domain-containing protein [Chloroflexi bacterium]|nr:DUF2249 domain-containing protein [Chloroflexota bacterium]